MKKLMIALMLVLCMSLTACKDSESSDKNDKDTNEVTGASTELDDDSTSADTEEQGAASDETTEATEEAEASTEAKTVTIDELSTVNPGDKVIFGAYEQDNNLDNGAEPIEWHVLAVENGEAVLLSVNALDYKQYYPEKAAATWEDSTVRNWLNGEFYDGAFNDSEKALIAVSHNEYPGNYIMTEDKHYTGGLTYTDDNVWLLSFDECMDYFGIDRESFDRLNVDADDQGELVLLCYNADHRLQAAPTTYALSSFESLGPLDTYETNKVMSDAPEIIERDSAILGYDTSFGIGYGQWLLRSASSISEKYVGLVGPWGNVSDSGASIHYYYLIRPAIRVFINK